MWKIYLIGIMYVIMFLNIPFVRDHTIAQVQIYKPKVQTTIIGIGDKYTPALQSIIADLTKSKQTIINGHLIDTVSKKPVDTSDDWSLSHKSSITADQFDAILRDYDSPAMGLGATVTTYADSKTIDNAYILYMYIRESTAGTSGIATQTNSTGNIKCHLNDNCIEGFQAYGSIEEAFKDHIDLLAHYRDSLGDKDIIAALDRWAPAFENDQRKNCEEQDTLSYPCGLMENVKKWRQANNNIVQIQSIQPTGKTTDVVKGMHINANFNDYSCEAWGFQGCIHYGTDIAVEEDEAVYMPVDCTYITTGHYNDPARLGDYVMCNTTDSYEYYSGHLKDAITLTPGDFIPAGTIIGYGNKAVVGPHTHIQLRDPNGHLTDFMKYIKDK